MSAGFGDAQIAALQSALERSGAVEWEIYYEQDRELSIEIEDGQVDAFEAARSSGAAVRVLANGRVGFAYASDFSAAAIQFTVEAALATAAICDPDPYLTLTRRAEAAPLFALDLCDRTLERVAKADKVARARELEDAARAVPGVARVRKASYGEGRGHVRLVNSHGLDLEDESTLVHCDVLVVAEKDGDEQLGWESQMGHFLHELDVAECGRVASERAVALLGARKAATGRYALVLEPHVACELLDVLGEGLLGESVAKGRSPFAGKQGLSVMSETVTIVDDGIHPRGAASSRFDGEGMPRRRTPLVVQGVLAGFLYDRAWGARAGVGSTGSSDRAGFRAPPSLGTSNLILSTGAPGDALALCREMDEGILVRELIGIHTADPVSGEFSVGASGLMVRRGEPAEPVSGIAIAGNLTALLRGVRRVGSDLRFYGTTGAPSIVLESVDVAGS